jgi:ABC-2 type transport system ATP-binding protein
MIGRLAADGKSVLISSHILTELAEMCHTVGIIEQGQLLAVGRVEDIRREVRPANVVKATLLRDAAKLVEWLGLRSDVGEFRVDGERVWFAHTGDRESEAKLLKAIIEAGFAVIEFGAQQQSLEEVFMHVTRGRVQ